MRSAALVCSAAVLIAAACGVAGDPSSSPVASPAATAGPPAGQVASPTACYGLRLDQCHEIAALALGRLAMPRVAWLEVGPPPCEAGVCPVRLPEGETVEVIAHVDDGQPWWLDVRDEDGTLIALPPRRIEMFAVEPDSRAETALGAYPFSLGHCGVYSPIDFDGSFWDPVGRVDFNASAAINSADGTLVLLAPSNARFVTPDGFGVDLVRHSGTKHFRGCD